MVFAGIEHPTSRLWGERANPYRSLSQWDKAIGPGEGRGKVGGKSNGNIPHLELLLPIWKKKIQPGTFSSRLEEKVPTWKFFLPAGRKIPTWEFFLPPGRKTSHQRNQDGVTILIY